MPDISLRFHKDMLVLSTPIDYQLEAQGFTEPTDREYVCLCEPELIEETYKLEQVMETPCLVTATEGITRARLAYSRFEDQADEIARIAYETASKFSPQHILAAIGPSGLPLDPTLASSIKQSVQQYGEAAKALMVHPFDGIFLSRFERLDDALCAIQGVRSVFEGPLAITLSVDGTAELSDGHSLMEAIQVCDEAGADVLGFASFVDPAQMQELAQTVQNATSKPKIAEIAIHEKVLRLAEPTDENPYPHPDEVFDVALMLREKGFQFLRATGAATPSYTGALIAAVMGTDVVSQ